MDTGPDPLVSRRRLLAYGAAGAAMLASGACSLTRKEPSPSASPATGIGGPTLWGAYVAPGKLPAIKAIEQFETMIGRQLDLTRHYIIWDRDIVNEPIVRSAAGGRIPFIALQAKRQ